MVCIAPSLACWVGVLLFGERSAKCPQLCGGCRSHARSCVPSNLEQSWESQYEGSHAFAHPIYNRQYWILGTLYVLRCTGLTVFRRFHTSHVYFVFSRSASLPEKYNRRADRCDFSKEMIGPLKKTLYAMYVYDPSVRGGARDKNCGTTHDGKCCQTRRNCCRLVGTW